MKRIILLVFSFSVFFFSLSAQNSKVDSLTKINYINVCNSGINENDLTNNISIYPNPTKETLNITNAEKRMIHIYNVLGEEVINTKCNEGNNTINVSKLSAGSYIVKIVSAKGVVVKKLIIEV